MNRNCKAGSFIWHFLFINVRKLLFASLTKFTVVAFMFLIIFAFPRFAATGDSYGLCDEPLQNYKCYDTRETTSCPAGLSYVRGWCSDPPGKRTQCCAPIGTPEGKRVGGPGLQSLQAQVRESANLKTQNFQLFLEGTLSCGYKVVSNGHTTKETTFPCDSYVTINIGPDGDCKDEGTDTCEVINDGGYLGRAKSYKFSIKFIKQTTSKGYGSCKQPYHNLQCMDKIDCISSGGNPIKGYCPRFISPNILCCTHAETAEMPDSNSFIFEKTKEKTLSNTASINNQLASIKQKYNVRIIIDIVDEIPTDTEKYLKDKFHFLYKLDEDTTTGIDMIFVYGKSKNIWRGVGFKGCRIKEEVLKKIISDPEISKEFAEKDYDSGFRKFVILLEDEVARKVNTGDFCKDIFTRQRCSEVCNEWYAAVANVFRDCKQVCEDSKCVWENEKCVEPSIEITQDMVPKEVVIVSSVNGMPDDNNKIVAFNNNVNLYALVRLEKDNKNLGWLTGANLKEAYVKGAKITAQKINNPINVKWFQIEPEAGHMFAIDNSGSIVNLFENNCLVKGPKTEACELCPDLGPEDMNYCWYANPTINPNARSRFWYKGADLIVYNQKEYGNSWSVEADKVVGTSRYRAEVTLNGITVSSHGAPDESKPHKIKEEFYRQGITNNVHRISRRSDADFSCPDPFKGSEGCKFLSYMHSYTRVPWIWGAYPEQTDRYVGFDCAELAGGAYRQMTGKNIGDVSANSLATGPATKSVVNKRIWFDENGNTVDVSRKPITIRIGRGENEVHIGDLILLDYNSDNQYDHTTIFLGDKNNNGILDVEDNIVTSCHYLGKITIEKEKQVSLLGRLWNSILNICSIKRKNVEYEERLNADSICNYDVQYELKTKKNIAWVIRRFV